MRFFETKRFPFSHPSYWLFSLLAVALSANQADAGLILEWDFSDNRGITDREPSAFSAAHLNGIDFYRGSGLTARAANGSFNSSGWGSQSSEDFIGFGIDIDPGYSLELDNLQIRTYSYFAGPGTVGLYYSGDNFTTPLYSIDQPILGFADRDFELSGFGELTGRVEFRLLEIGNESTIPSIPTQDVGRFGVANYRGGASVQFRGTVSSSIPEPSACLLLLGACLQLNRRRTRSLYRNQPA